MTMGGDMAGFLAAALAPVRPVRLADVGANPITEPLYRPLAELGLSEVTGFEPDPEAYASLTAQVPGNATFLNVAVGIPGAREFHAYPESDMSSVYPLSAAAVGYLGHFRRHLGKQRRFRIEMAALDDLEAVPPLDFLKIDAQGAERDVILGAHDKLRRAVAVVAEMRFYRLYEGEPALNELDAELRAQGFVLHRFLHQKARMLRHSQWDRVDRTALASQLIDGDAVYIRSLEDRAGWDDMQLKHLALLAALLFDSHDLALLCLDELAARGAVPRDLPGRYVDHLPAAMRAPEKEVPA